MQKFIFVLLCFLSLDIYAQTTVLIPAGSTTAQIQNYINTAASASSGGTALFAAGTYSLTGSITIPCPTTSLVVSGPVVPLASYTTGDGYSHLGYTPTSTILPPANFYSGGSSWMFATTYGCSKPVTIQFLEFNGGQPTSGGGSVYVAPATSYFTSQYNYMHGNNGPRCVNCYGSNDNGLLFFDWSQPAAPAPVTLDSNNTVQWMRFGANGDCGSIAIDENYNPYNPSGGTNSESLGGWCNGLSSGGANTNFTITNNVFYYLEQGMKFWEGPCVYGTVINYQTGQKCTTPFNELYVTTNRLIAYNDFSNIHRIGVESQQTPTTSTFFANYQHDALNPASGTWYFSVPEQSSGSCGAISCSALGNSILSNIFAWNVAVGGNPAYGAGPTIEFWGAGNFNNNFSQGYAGCGMQFGFYSVPPVTPQGQQILYNIMRMYNVNQYGFTCNEEGITVYPNGSVQAGNFSTYNFGINSGGTSNSWAGTLTSQSPTICVSGASSCPSNVTISTPTTVILSDPGWTTSTAIPGYSTGYGPQGNTSIWYTTDGSTPVPGSGTAKYAASGSTIIVQPGTTTVVKAVGMWGAANQAVQYPANFGFSPSAVVTTTFTGGTPPSLVSLSPVTFVGGGNSVAAGSTLQACANLNYSNPSTTTQICGSGTDAYGNSVSLWSSSAVGVATISSSGLVTGVAVGSSSITAKVSTFTSAGSTLNVTSGPNPTIVSGYQGNANNVNTLAVGQAAVQQLAYGTYSDGNTRVLPDAYGNTPKWSSQNSAVLQVTSSGLINCLTASSTTVYSYVFAEPQNLEFYEWGWTCNAAPTLTSITLATTGNISTLTVGATNQLIVTAHYSDGSTQTPTTGITYASSSPSVASVSITGLVTAVANGSTNLTATYGGLTNNTPVVLTVTGGIVLSSITITQAQSINTLIVGQSISFGATCKYSDNSTTSCGSSADTHGNQVTWGSSNTAAGTISSTGTLLAVGPGTGTVTAVISTIAATPYSMTYLSAPTTPMVLDITGASINITGSTLTISYQ